MATYDELVALDNKLKTHQSHLQFLATEIYKSKNKLNPIFMWNRRNISHIHGEGVLPLNSKCKHSEIWNTFIKIQRNCFVEQPTNKVLKI